MPYSVKDEYESPLNRKGNKIRLKYTLLALFFYEERRRKIVKNLGRRNGLWFTKSFTIELKVKTEKRMFSLYWKAIFPKIVCYIRYLIEILNKKRNIYV